MTNNTQVEELADEKCSDLKDDYTITRQTEREREKQRDILMNTGTCFHLCHYVEQTWECESGSDNEDESNVTLDDEEEEEHRSCAMRICTVLWSTDAYET